MSEINELIHDPTLYEDIPSGEGRLQREMAVYELLHELDIPFKRMLERMVVNREPYYTMIEGETCHLGISQLKKKLLVIGYGDINDQEKAIFKDLLDASTLGFTYSSVDAYFCDEDELEDVLHTFGGVDHV